MPPRAGLFDPSAIDHLLESPLGLGKDTPDSCFLATPLFEDDGLDNVPALEFSTLFPEVSLPGSESQPTALTPPSVPLERHVTDPCSTPFAFPSLDLNLNTTRSSKPGLAQLPIPEESVPVELSLSSHKRACDLTPVDAPIQPRTYLVPSATGRKRRTVAIERELLKRGRAPSVALDSATIVDEDLPQDLIEATERKRLQNTLSARKSRQRKAAKLEELETRNESLQKENEALQTRVIELEALLRGIALQV